MSGVDQDELAAEFEQHRRRLVGVAYRMLGSLSEAEDAVQDAWLRLARSDRSRIEELGAWLTTVVSRLCLDRLRSARMTREKYVGPWLPEPLVADLGQAAVGPAELVEIDESVRFALLVVLDRLSPEQRVAFVLHDVFAVPFGEVAASLGTSSAAARQLASRARRAVQREDGHRAASRERQLDVVEAFFRAVSNGDLDALLRALAPDVVLTSDGGGKARAALRPVLGADKVARFLLGLPSYYPGVPFSGTLALVNGEVGLVVQARPTSDGAPEVGVFLPHVADDGLVHGVDVVRNPDKLGDLEVLALLAGGQGPGRP